ncbi:MAG TPA: bifunctional (p)ppGpp synthetase/guanosine-3',5'-bis(diphosphate) 3'-pyrophosphohydrolase [Thermomicrobiales bacterium]|nr:bifunctional (p)ppGpp synthetase/guanosine-3',5'-bis(diphosphate) 3'-pyrophosphohydrolase [Thermomicrobiales bacterium]
MAIAATQLTDQPDSVTLRDLLDILVQENPGMDTSLIERAYQFAATAHADKRRKSGEPYIIHPLRVAIILAEMQLDPETLVASLLHDVVEDTNIEVADIEKEFGQRIAALVEGVTKLSRIPWSGEVGDEERATREVERQAESLRKMFLAMADDVRVVLIKLADRLHNMRTLDHVPRESQLHTAQQTMEIYAPLANRLGIWQIKSELEDLAFLYLDPQTYHQTERSLQRRGVQSARYIELVQDQLSAALAAAGIDAEIKGREKHIYSIWRKMQRKDAGFDEIYDIIGLRITVNENKDCYGALGVIHTLWRPIPGEFDDYIATPKESMYQSIHTSVLGPDAHPIEIQIRTHEMHHIAEYGIAAHWRYKEGRRVDPNVEAKVAWLRQLMDWRDEVVDAHEFVESLKSDVFREMIYVFTPRGDIVELPAGATPIDFAYRIHTEVGHQCVGAKVNDQLVTLDTRLSNGAVVRIMTSKTKVGPSRDWLMPSSGYVTTAGAREKIRQWFRRQERDENISQGRDIIEREMRRLGIESKIDDIARQFTSFQRVDDFLAAVGYGGITPQQIATRLVETREPEVFAPPTTPTTSTIASNLQVMGVGDLYTRLAACCKPVYGDDIVGYVTRGRGITVHRADCHNMKNVDEEGRQVPVSWGDQAAQSYPVSVRLEAWDRVGLLRDITALVADEKVNMLSVLTNVHEDRTVTVLMTIEVGGVTQLSRVLQKLEAVRDVFDVRREAAPKAATG